MSKTLSKTLLLSNNEDYNFMIYILEVFNRDV